MALREHSRPVPAGRSGRHGRPRPFGGRLRLPTIRFSGAAMAMSTVVGISLATTWLLNEQQQQVGRRAGVTVGGPPAPGSDATPGEAAPTTGPAPATTVQAAPATAGGTGAGAAPTPSGSPHGPDAPGDEAHPAASSPSAPPVRPAAATSPAPALSPSTSPAAAATAPTPPPSATASAAASASASAGASPTADPHTRPMSLAAASPAPGTASASAFVGASLPRTLRGAARTDPLGPTGTRHTLRLDLDETMTALQVELRLNRPTTLPGTAPATDLPGAVVTIALERDTLVYRFTAPADLPLPPGSYTVSVTGALPPPPPAPPETWTASAFALPTTRALAARGTF
ncbi:hypothetical protein [Kitasatospora saccharophila]